MNFNRRLLLASICLLLVSPSNFAMANPQTVAKKSKTVVSLARKPDYDPLKIPNGTIKTLELMIEDVKRNRKYPALVYLPSDSKAAPVIIHSHGLGGQKETSPFLGKHWAARGYVAVFLQHPGSDDSVWKGVSPLKIMGAMKKAASAKNLTLRTGDVKAAIDQLEEWHLTKEHPLEGRLDLKHIGMSGHSFGAVTTQNVSGQKNFGGNKSDPRIRAAIPMSPSVPRIGEPVAAFRAVKIPWLCMTGTKDNSVIGGATSESRLKVFKALPAGDKFELVLHDAEHFVFTETNLKRNQRKKRTRNPNHHTAIKAITTAFWDTYLREDKNAKTWLHSSESVRRVLETKDRWQSK